MRRIPWITLALASLACLAHASQALGSWMEFQRAAVNTHGEVWRLLTAHFAHFDADHLLWDISALLILGIMEERKNIRAFAITLGGAAFLIGIGVWVGQPHLETYRGLSGIDSALYGLACARLARDGWRARHGFSIMIGALALAGFAFKCAAELTSGATVFATSVTAGYAPVPVAHLLGLATGITVALMEGIRSRPANDAASRPRLWGWPCPWRLSSPAP